MTNEKDIPVHDQIQEYISRGEQIPPELQQFMAMYPPPIMYGAPTRSKPRPGRLIHASTGGNTYRKPK